MNAWLPIEKVALINGRDYCVGRGPKIQSDIGTWYESTGWACMGDEWGKELPVLFILNGEPLPNTSHD